MERKNKTSSNWRNHEIKNNSRDTAVEHMAVRPPACNLPSSSAACTESFTVQFNQEKKAMILI